MTKKIQEFGSDYHFLIYPETEGNIKYAHLSDSHFYADGRHALIDLLSIKLLRKDWKRIWMPEYFCYDVVRSVLETGIEVKFYPDNPVTNDNLIINRLKFRVGDVLLRMNYFGLRDRRENDLPIEVIEDHSHDMTSLWASESNADYCIASLRKSLPLPEGGILWSPKHNIDGFDLIPSSIENDRISYKKLAAMLMKNLYLEGYKIQKQVFREMMISFEQELDHLPVSGISEAAREMFLHMPIDKIQNAKKKNWILLSSIIKKAGFSILEPENLKHGTPFSLILILSDAFQRDKIKNLMLKSNIYPAVLWNIPESSTTDIYSLGTRILSIHCDIRYDKKDIMILGNTIVNIIKQCS